MSNPEILREQALREIQELREQKRHPEVRKDTDIIWIFAGAGTIETPLLPEEPSWQRYRDSHRDRYAAVLAIMITAKKLGKNPKDITREDFSEHGPMIFYDGGNLKNKAFETWVNSHSSKIPREKVKIVYSVKDGNGNHNPIQNTLDNVKSFPEDLLDGGDSPKRIALVSHAEHFPRIWRYLKMWFPQKDNVRFYTYPVKIQAEWTRDFGEIESKKPPEYFTKGHLAYDPIPHDRD